MYSEFYHKLVSQPFGRDLYLKKRRGCLNKRIKIIFTVAPNEEKIQWKNVFMFSFLPLPLKAQGHWNLISFKIFSRYTYGMNLKILSLCSRTITFTRLSENLTSDLKAELKVFISLKFIWVQFYFIYLAPNHSGLICWLISQVTDWLKIMRNSNV